MEPVLLWSGLVGFGVLVLTWVLYPAVIGLLSLRSSKRSFRPDYKPRVSVVLATRDDERVIRDRVEDLVRTGYPLGQMEIIVAVDSGVKEREVAVPDLTGEATVRVVLSQGFPGKAGTLNEGVKRATGEILVFCDASQRFDPDAIQRLVEVFADPGTGGATGTLALKEGAGGTSLIGLYWAYEKWLRRREAAVHSTVGVSGSISAMRASLWEELPGGLILDDVFTPMRLVMEGHRIAFVETAIATETRVPTISEEHRRKVRTLTGVFQLCAWLSGILVPWKNPLFFQFVFHKLFRLLTPYAISILFLVGVCIPFVVEHPLAGWSGVVGGTVLLLVLLGWPRPLARVRSILGELVLTQKAVVQATVNGLRGNWDVWN